MRKLVLHNNQAPGDLVVLTATLRDLHRTYPGEFLTDIRCHGPEVFWHNPHITPLNLADPDVEVVECVYPAVQESNRVPIHFLQGFMEDLNAKLNLAVRPTEFRGEIYLSEEEKAALPECAKEIDPTRPFWVISAGGKFDYTIKWWDRRRWQRVVDHFKGRLQFVQIGAKGNFHPPLQNTIDLRGKTNLRELICLIHHSAGVLCPVTAVMHMAAAVETKPEQPSSRACVVVAGGREPAHWAAYPTHQYLHTVGTLDCCRLGGCWRARTVPLGDGAEHDLPARVCVDTRNNLPRCMDMITASRVIEAVSYYLEARS